MSRATHLRSVHHNIEPAQIIRYRLPVAGVVSILHRASGALLFLLLPFVIWAFDASTRSEVGFDIVTSAVVAGIWFVPGWFVKLALLVLIGAFLLHLVAGIRHLWMDMTHSVSQVQGASSARLALALGAVLTLALGAKLFGLY